MRSDIITARRCAVIDLGQNGAAAVIAVAAAGTNTGTAADCRSVGGSVVKISDIDKVNHLIGELKNMDALIAHTNDADPADCELFKLRGDSSIKMSSEGAASTALPRLLSVARFSASVATVGNRRAWCP